MKTVIFFVLFTAALCCATPPPAGKPSAPAAPAASSTFADSTSAEAERAALLDHIRNQMAEINHVIDYAECRVHRRWWQLWKKRCRL